MRRVEFRDVEGIPERAMIVVDPEERDIDDARQKHFLRKWRAIRSVTRAPTVERMAEIGLSSLADWLSILEPLDDGEDFEYLRYGKALRAAYGRDMTGRTTKDFSGPHGSSGHFFRECNSISYKEVFPVYSRMAAPSDLSFRRWDRLIVPVFKTKNEPRPALYATSIPIGLKENQIPGRASQAIPEVDELVFEDRDALSLRKIWKVRVRGLAQPVTCISNPEPQDISDPRQRWLLLEWLSFKAQNALPGAEILRSPTAKSLSAHISILEPVDGGQDFRFVRYGKILEEILGPNAQGRKLSEVRSQVGPIPVLGLFRDLSAATFRHGVATFCRHRPISEIKFAHWDRLIFPIQGRRGPTDLLLFVTNVPHGKREGTSTGKIDGTKDDMPSLPSMKSESIGVKKPTEPKSGDTWEI